MPLALFSQTLDQSQTDNSFGIDVFAEPGQIIYQSFTAGMSGALSSVELSFESTMGAENLLVEIFQERLKIKI